MKTYAIALLISSSAAVENKTHTAAKSVSGDPTRGGPAWMPAPATGPPTEEEKEHCDVRSGDEGGWTRWEVSCPKNTSVVHKVFEDHFQANGAVGPRLTDAQVYTSLGMGCLTETYRSSYP